jgi:hypothetical protein
LPIQIIYGYEKRASPGFEGAGASQPIAKQIQKAGKRLRAVASFSLAIDFVDCSMQLAY